MAESLAEERAHSPILTEADVDAWRDGDWVFVTLAGELVYRRYTRDRGFTHAWVVFHGNRSPDYPRQRRFFDRVELHGDWKMTWGKQHWLRNRLEVPIRDGKEQP